MKRVLFLILFVTGCGVTQDTSKGLSEEIKSSFRRANEKQDLLRARDQVRKAKSKYNDCLNDNSTRRSVCDGLKLEYEQKVEYYTEIQRKK